MCGVEKMLSWHGTQARLAVFVLYMTLRGFSDALEQVCSILCHFSVSSIQSFTLVMFKTIMHYHDDVHLHGFFFFGEIIAVGIHTSYLLIELLNKNRLDCVFVRLENVYTLLGHYFKGKGALICSFEICLVNK